MHGNMNANLNRLTCSKQTLFFTVFPLFFILTPSAYSL